MSTDYREFLEDFRRVYQADDRKGYIKKWIVRWRYVDIMQNKQEFYQTDRLYDWQGKEELPQWLDYCTKHVRLNYFPEDWITPLIPMCKAKDQEVFEKLGLEWIWSDEVYDTFIARNNINDFKLQNFYPVPERYRVKRVLDFGAGYGRQANLWSQQAGATYVAMDAVPNSYCTQNLYLQSLGVPFADYVDDTEGFQIKPEPGIYHLPTWRYDLLPDNYFDMVACTQVLSEISGPLAKRMIKEFMRVLKPGGALYVRDPGPYMHKTGNKVHIDNYITRQGFHLEFEPYMILAEDMNAFPRIWRKPEPAVEAARRRKETMADTINYYTRGNLKKIYRKLTGK